MTIRVFLVDDQELVRAGLRMVVAAQEDMQVVGEAGNGAEALERLAVTRADVVLMDVRMPRVDGVEATRRLRGSGGSSGSGGSGGSSDPGGSSGSSGSGGASGAGVPDDAPRVIVLTTFDLDEYVFSAVRAGASGFLLKDARPEELLSAIRSVHSGDAVVAPSATRRLLERFAPHLPAGEDERSDGVDPRLGTLTDRERQVLLEVARGLSNAEIAAQLYLSEATVKTHVGRILAKLDVRDRVQLVVLAYRNRLVEAG